MTKYYTLVPGTIAAYGNCYTIANIIDELDYVLGGYGHASPQFLYSFNTFVETYVLHDHICISRIDANHLNLASPFFGNGRPLLSSLVKDRTLAVLDEGSEHTSGDPAKVIWVRDLSKDENISSSGSWFQEYIGHVTEYVERDYIKYIARRYDIGKGTKWTPLLIAVRGGQSIAVAYCMRDLNKFGVALTPYMQHTWLHPMLPVYATHVVGQSLAPPSCAMELYGRLADIHGISVERILRYQGCRRMPVPPFTSILLGRCTSREKIVPHLRQLRTEFSCLRDTAREHQSRIRNAQSLGEQCDIIDEFEEYWATFCRKMKKPSNRLAYRIWDVIKDETPLKWLTKSLDLLVEYDKEKTILNRYKGLTSVWQLTRQAPGISTQLRSMEKLFDLRLNSHDWDCYKKATEQQAKAFEKLPAVRGQ
jgi:hypothetical protein